MARYYFANYGLNTSGVYNFQWDIITHQSSVFVSAAEGSEVFENGRIALTTQSPQRFVGDARFNVSNIAPHDGGVTFSLEIDWPGPLNTWVCITVFDAADYSGVAA